MILFVDTSALGSAYLGEEPDGAWVTDVVLHGDDPVVACELADVEVASLLARARRDGRIDQAGVDRVLELHGAYTADDGPIGVVPVNGETICMARSMVLEAPVRTLDALHLAAARLLAAASGDTVEILTLDGDQADVALSLGFGRYRPPRD
ncbi:MAG: type II toxin-antitoxin system VapC family toxin [Acidimicrobiales bacterium]